MKRTDIRATVLAFAISLLAIGASVERAEAQAQPITVVIVGGQLELPGSGDALTLDSPDEARRSRRRGAWLITAGLSLAVPSSISLALFAVGQSIDGYLSEAEAIWLGFSVVGAGLGLVLVALGAWQRARGNAILRELKVDVTERGATVGWSGSF